MNVKKILLLSLAVVFVAAFGLSTTSYAKGPANDIYSWDGHNPTVTVTNADLSNSVAVSQDLYALDGHGMDEAGTTCSAGPAVTVVDQYAWDGLWTMQKLPAQVCG